MATGVKSKKVSAHKDDVEQDYSLNDVLLRERVSREAIEKELPSIVHTDSKISNKNVNYSSND